MSSLVDSLDNLHMFIIIDKVKNCDIGSCELSEIPRGAVDAIAFVDRAAVISSKFGMDAIVITKGFRIKRIELSDKNRIIAFLERAPGDVVTVKSGLACRPTVFAELAPSIEFKVKLLKPSLKSLICAYCLRYIQPGPLYFNSYGAVCCGSMSCFSILEQK